MGSNANRHGDKHVAREWGSKARKEEASLKRHAHDRRVIEDELDPRPTPGGKKRKKDTRRWCRGKEGREHVMTFYPPEIEKTGPLARYFNRGQTKCANCGITSWRVSRGW